ncbi:MULTISPECIES: FeoA family protein [Anaerococcus]|mgnify:FL=1|jgi:feoA family protein|uniref:Ferrous iron transport protein A n=1 Tax=Anaerococcus octavius TaxID=54007 RepID=A0A2I1M963_9FIRM|nr:MULTISPECIES: ferrous iron transport protein A [Anaerococcus]MDU0893715.1 ferrous iron transport protein A [Anaerococcus sp.]MDU3176884.1 ferrous iron transport protein A [Anaerococcus sp.]MDU7411427.1 ferrous iron transport protein A [Anaerococcus sp.]PKZ16658.1 ferrous iron transport protein A [Anaerococcus octavius]
MKSLRDAKVGENLKVVKIKGDGPTKRRIMDMGITKNTDIFVRKVAPLGDPVQISLRGYELTIRKHDAENIMVEEL